ncbi:hypothetical protein FOF52_04670 [Thermobifida alba]|uniref:Uncharacterized protein n=1 Tax=Thermobifida alba TaxID=53522 RepID=A0ABY4L215_THEAE|nr:hypothetical protein [Thermobifida alba]UPT20343.1 hypothetical protein FOF52_04670 [Thermobifida alba]
MRQMRAAAGTALATWRQRVREPSFLAALLASAALAHLAVPDPESRWVVVGLGEYRAEYNSAYVGTAAALSGALWLSLAGFYVVTGTGGRGGAAGLAQVLAAGPLRGWAHYAGRFTGNLAVLADAVPGLRKGAGTLVWFPVWLALVIAAQGRVLGTGPVAESMRDQMAGQGIEADTAEFAVGLMQIDSTAGVFSWSGFELPWGYLAERLAVVLGALLVALLPALWFRRAAPGRGRRAADGAPEAPRPWRRVAYRGLAAAPDRSLGAFARTVAARSRVLARSMPRWWWAVAAAVNAAALAVPGGTVPAVLLAAWIWPVLLWSGLGTRHPGRGDVDAVLAACPARRRRVAAEWAAGMLLTALTGLGPLVRMAATADWPGVAAWAGGAAFVASLALVLGTVSGTRRLFQAGYTPLWYLVLNGVSAVDFLGAVRVGGRLAGPPPGAVLLAAVALFAAAVAVAELRHARR